MRFYFLPDMGEKHPQCRKWKSVPGLWPWWASRTAGIPAPVRHSSAFASVALVAVQRRQGHSWASGGALCAMSRLLSRSAPPTATRGAIQRKQTIVHSDLIDKTPLDRE